MHDRKPHALVFNPVWILYIRRKCLPGLRRIIKDSRVLCRAYIKFLTVTFQCENVYIPPFICVSSWTKCDEFSYVIKDLGNTCLRYIDINIVKRSC